jgi:hypothetical protein
VAAAQKKVCEVVEDDVRRTQPLVAYLVGRMCLAWSVSMGLAHHSKAEHMHALVFGHVDSLVRKRLFGCLHEYRSCNASVSK